MEVENMSLLLRVDAYGPFATGKLLVTQTSFYIVYLKSALLVK